MYFNFALLRSGFFFGGPGILIDCNLHPPRIRYQTSDYSSQQLSSSSAMLFSASN